MESFFYYLYLIPGQVEYPFKRREPTTNAIITNQRSHINTYQPLQKQYSTAPILLTRPPTQQPIIQPSTNLVLPYSSIITYTKNRNHPNANPKTPLTPLYLLSAPRETILPRPRRHPSINKGTKAKLARLRISRKQLMESVLYAFRQSVTPHHNISHERETKRITYPIQLLHDIKPCSRLRSLPPRSPLPRNTPTPLRLADHAPAITTSLGAARPAAAVVVAGRQAPEGLAVRHARKHPVVGRRREYHVWVRMWLRRHHHAHGQRGGG
jgi:hypothetical protein